MPLRTPHPRRPLVRAAARRADRPHPRLHARVDRPQRERPGHHADRAVRVPRREPAVPVQPDPGRDPARVPRPAADPAAAGGRRRARSVAFGTEQPGGVLVETGAVAERRRRRVHDARRGHVWPLTARAAVRARVEEQLDADTARVPGPRPAPRRAPRVDDVLRYRTVFGAADPARPGGDRLDPATSVDGRLYVALLTEHRHRDPGRARRSRALHRRRPRPRVAGDGGRRRRARARAQAPPAPADAVAGLHHRRRCPTRRSGQRRPDLARPSRRRRHHRRALAARRRAPAASRRPVS